jgi:uncharacterized membrane protein
MMRAQRIVLVLGAVVAVAALVWVLRATHPELGTGAAESTWAPHGLEALATRRGLAALGLAALALVFLVVALRPGRRASPATFFDETEKQAIRAAIAAAEDRTSGEIRLHLARRTRGDVLRAAEAAFQAIGMTRTAARNGVLIYLSVEDHRFAIIGDEGIDRVVPEGFWDEIKATMRERFAADRFAEGIAEAAGRVGEKLHAYFPLREGDVNELSDEISTEP